MVEIIIFLYVFFTGCVYTSWMWDKKYGFVINFLNIFFGFINGWYITPILIGRTIRKIYKD